MLICKECGEVIGDSPRSNKGTVCVKCIVKKKVKEDNSKYSVWGEQYLPKTNGEQQEELLDYAGSIKDAEYRIAQLRKIKYFKGWKLWYELSI